MKLALSFLCSLLIMGFKSSAQYPNKLDHDTTYFRSFRGAFIGRVYLSRNYTLFKLVPPGNLPAMTYHVNTPLNIGLGFTYQSFSVSVSHGLHFLQSDQSKGRTQATNILVHLYRRKWIMDAMGQFYRGYYLGPRGLAAPGGEGFYLRPDIRMQLVGISAYRIMNDKRFSYGAGLAQNGWQQKSAGSFMWGGQAYYSSTAGDSAFAPSSIDSLYNLKNIHKFHVFEMGPGIGYAYTLVYDRHYFLLGSLNVNLNLRFSREIGNGIRADAIGFSSNFIARVGCGYNSSRWGIHLIWIYSTIRAEGKFSDYAYQTGSGTYRLVYARRLAFNRHMKHIIGND